MQLHRRAVYNMVHLPDAVNVDELEPWQKENYRTLKDSTLFMRLQDCGITIPNLKMFSQLAAEFESPDEMADELAPHDDQIYLLLFELWRRHLPDQRCPSVFCDELDYQIGCFEKDELERQDEIEEIVDYLEQILDDHVDEGAEPRAVYQAFQQHCAHNLDQFLYSYTATQIDLGNTEYAYDLIEGFYRYIDEPLFFDFLLARIAIIQNREEGTAYLTKLLKKVKRLDLAEEILIYLAQEHNHSLFCQLVAKTTALLENEASFKELLDLCILHYDELNLNTSELQAMIVKRSSFSPESLLDQNDADVKELKKLMKKGAEVIAE